METKTKKTPAKKSTKTIKITQIHSVIGATPKRGGDIPRTE